MQSQEIETKIVNFVSSRIEKICVRKKNDSSNCLPKIGIVSCINYQNHTAIKRLFMILKAFNNSFIILGGGNKWGADGYIRQMSTNLKYQFIEYIPTHFEHRETSFFPKKFHNSRFNVDNFNIRYQYLFFDCDMLFILKDTTKEDISIKRLIEYSRASQASKDVFIIDENYIYSK